MNSALLAKILGHGLPVAEPDADDLSFERQRLGDGCDVCRRRLALTAEVRFQFTFDRCLNTRTLLTLAAAGTRTSETHCRAKPTLTL